MNAPDPPHWTLNWFFWYVSYCLVALGTVWLPYETQCKTDRSSGKVRATKSRRNFRNKRTRNSPLDPKLMFWCVSYHWVHSGPYGCLTKLCGKPVNLVQKFVPRSCVRIFCNERTWSTPFGPKLTFWCILYHLGASRTAWLPYETQCKMCRTSVKVCATKSRHNFSQQTNSIHLIGT